MAYIYLALFDVAASSTTGPDLHSTERDSPRTNSKDPSTWSIEDVMKFVKDADPMALAPHADLFRRHVSVFQSCQKYFSSSIPVHQHLFCGKICHLYMF